jgi:ectoine hydroxylase-related dioxygenase (phytanoyl-CoA dioxygenase family)
VISEIEPKLEFDGFQLFPRVFLPGEVEGLVAALPEVTRGGVRSLLDDVRVMRVARDRRLAAIVGEAYFAVRAVLFDKTADSNWGLRWHQDLSIATRARRDVAGFAGWTVKAGVPHVTAPVELLRSMVTLRIHLDDCGPDVGPLRVIPRSHLLGRVPESEIGEHAAKSHVCTAARGDVLAFKPLLLHASEGSRTVGHRRVLQVEYARDELAGGLEWRWRV